jgi:predicted XRE-type DNA-binding protein
MTDLPNQIHRSNPNIFAELGLPDPETHLLKAQIVTEIYRLVTGEKLTQTAAGMRMGISQPEVSRLFKGNFREYSIERLIMFLACMGQDVRIVSSPHMQHEERGVIAFEAA